MVDVVWLFLFLFVYLWGSDWGIYNKNYYPIINGFLVKDIDYIIESSNTILSMSLEGAIIIVATEVAIFGAAIFMYLWGSRCGICGKFISSCSCKHCIICGKQSVLCVCKGGPTF